MRHLAKLISIFLLLPFALSAAESTATPSDQTMLARGNMLFAAQLYATLGTDQTKPLFFSPISISTALAMVYGGAAGETATQMEKVLRFGPLKDRLHPAMAELLRTLNAEGNGGDYQLSINNALWYQKGFQFKSDYLKLVTNNYGAGLNGVDFVDQVAACRIINNWVDQQTRHKIPTIISAGDVNQKTKLVLTNAVYFKGKWQKPFKKEDTKNDSFYDGKDKPASVPFLHQTDKYGYLDGGTFQALSIPYVKYDLSMVVFVPKDKNGLAAFEKNLTAVNLDGWLSSLKSTPNVELSLPKFKMESSFELSDAFKTMGMPQAFDFATADFSGMTGRRELYISKVIHKAYVDVNEEGTEAAAATAVMASLGAVAVPSSPPTIFRADHPFIFLIKDNESGAILFLGRVLNPAN